MPKKNRIRGSEMRTMRPARRIHGALFSLSMSPAGGAPRMTCVVSKKVAAHAVDRNLIKRRCRAALSGLAAALPGGAFVFTAKREAQGASYADIVRDIHGLADKISGRSISR